MHQQPSNTLSPEMIRQMQQMTHFAYFALGLSVKHLITVWHLDSEASNHMSHSPKNLDPTKKYDGELKILTANGDSVPITVVGNVRPQA